MELAVSAWSVERLLKSKSMSNEDFIDFCADNGVFAVELLENFRGEDLRYEKLKEKLDRAKVRCRCYSIDGDLVCREPGYSASMSEIREGVDIAASLGAKCVRIFPGSEKEGIPTEEGYSLIRRGLVECCRYAARRGVFLCMENHGVYGGRSDSLRRIMREAGSDFLLTNPDTGNFLLGGENPAEAVRALRGKIGNVHFKDMVAANPGMFTSYDGKEQYSGCILGRGIVPLKRIVDMLRESGYGGCVTIEYEGAEKDNAGALAESIRFTRSLLG